MTTWQFVDSIGSSPTVRLDLASGDLRASEFDLSPPPVRRVHSSSMLRDGAVSPASAYENRTIGLTIQLRSADVDSAATALQTLARELARETNLLKVQLTSATSPVFFRTYGEPQYTLAVLREKLQAGKAVLQLEAEPFALGLRETISPVTILNDPVSGGTNPGYFDVTSLKGDVETPLLLVFTGTGTGGVGGKQSVIAVRRRGDPTAFINLVQAEGMTPIGADTTVSAAGADAAMSGATNNYIRTTFATSATLSNRASDTFPANGTAVADARGAYRVFARYRKSGAGTAGDMTVQLGYGDSTSSLFLNTAVSLPAGAGPAFADVGRVDVPLGQDPGQFGYGTDLKALMNTIVWRAGRNSGALTLDLDYLLFVPCGPENSARLCIIDWPTKDTTYAVDGVQDMAYALNSSLDQVLTAEAAAGIAGGLPYVTPNQANRVYMIRDVTPGQADGVTNTTVVAPYYYPRYLTVRPATT